MHKNYSILKNNELLEKPKNLNTIINKIKWKLITDYYYTHII